MVEKNEVSVTTNEKDIPVKFANDHSKKKFFECLKDAGNYSNDACISLLQSMKYIYTDCNDIKTNYIRLGFHLSELKKRRYGLTGFYDFYEFVESNFGLDKSATSRCMSISDKFCRENGNFGHRTMFLNDKYKDYSYSQLCEMVSIKDEKLRNKIKPDMTIKQIRELKKNGGTLPAADSPVEDKQKKNPDQHLCVNDLTLSGAPRYNKMKKADPVSKCSKMITLVDPETGKDIKLGYYDILMDSDVYIYLRKNKKSTDYLIREKEMIIDLDINDAYKAIHKK